MEYKDAVFQEPISVFQKEGAKCQATMIEREIEELPLEYQKAVWKGLIHKLKLISEE